MLTGNSKEDARESEAGIFEQYTDFVLKGITPHVTKRNQPEGDDRTCVSPPITLLWFTTH